MLEGSNGDDVGGDSLETFSPLQSKRLGASARKLRGLMLQRSAIRAMLEKR